MFWCMAAMIWLAVVMAAWSVVLSLALIVLPLNPRGARQIVRQATPALAPPAYLRIKTRR